MRGRILVMAGFVCAFSFANAQTEEWRSLERQRKEISARGMYVLSGWAAGNLVVNSILAGESSGTGEYFYETNVAWNILNLGFAGIALHQISRTSEVPTWQAAFQEQYFTEQLFLVNSSFNIACISAGICLREKAKNADINSEWLKGSGTSLIFQGSFLLAFDAGMYFIHHRTQRKWTRYLQSVSAGPSGAGIEIPLR